MLMQGYAACASQIQRRLAQRMPLLHLAWSTSLVEIAGIKSDDRFMGPHANCERWLLLVQKVLLSRRKRAIPLTSCCMPHMIKLGISTRFHLIAAPLGLQPPAHTFGHFIAALSRGMATPAPQRKYASSHPGQSQRDTGFPEPLSTFASLLLLLEG